MGLCCSYGVGQYSASGPTEGHVAIWDRAYKPAGTARPLLWFHSAGGLGIEPWVNANQLVIFPALASLPILSADCYPPSGGHAWHWGNSTGQSRATDMRAFAQSQANLKASSGKVILAALSMGGVLALNWARANPTLVQAILLFYPVVNLAAIYNGTGGATQDQTDLNAAYGGSWTTNGGNPFDPAANASSYAGVPIYMGYSDVDTVVGTANQTAFISAVGGSALTTRVYAGASHGDLTKVDTADLRSWLGQYV